MYNADRVREISNTSGAVTQTQLTQSWCSRDGPIDTEKIRAQTGRAGASWATLRRAAALVDVTATRTGFGHAGSGCGGCHRYSVAGVTGGVRAALP
jgi:hypothetical protein